MSRKRVTATETRIRELDIPEEVKLLALENLAAAQERFKTRSFKQKAQNRVVFSCVLKAYFTRGITVDPKFMCRMIGMEGSRFGIDKTLSQYASELDPSLEGLISSYIDIYLNMIGMLNEREGIVSAAIDFAHKCTDPLNSDNKSVVAWTYNNRLSNVAVGLSTFYLMEKSDIPFRSKDWSKACTLTPCCISKYKKTFEECYNS